MFSQEHIGSGSLTIMPHVSRNRAWIAAGQHTSLWSYLREISTFHELLRFFIWRDSIVRYKQALLGVSWVILRPLLTMLLFTFLFGFVARFPSADVSYPLFVLAGMLPWQMYANSANDTCNSLINYSHLITKAYFPRLLLPVSQIVVHFVDFAINLALFCILALFLEAPTLGGHLLYFPLLLLWTFLLCTATGLWLAPLTARYRDVRFLVAFFIQFGMFVSPVGYGTFLIPSDWLWLYALNPLVGLIDAYRFVLLGLTPVDGILTISLSLFLTTVLFFSGLFYFRKVEETLADIL